MKITAIYITKSPLSQIKESVSNYSSFNQIKIFDENNNLIEIPIITANSVRGALRNAGAQYLLDLLNKKVNKNIFHLLFSGGAISTSIINDIDKAIEIREKHPFVSLFGGAVSDMMMSGKMNIGNLYPITKETKDITKIDSEVSYKTLLSDMQAIKRDDAKEEKLTQKYINEEYAEDVKQQMIYETEYLTVGTKLFQEINLINCNELEKGAFVSSLCYFLNNNARFGGKSNVGYGKFDADFDFENFGKIVYRDNQILSMSESIDKLLNNYSTFIESNKDKEDYFDCLNSQNKAARKK